MKRTLKSCLRKKGLVEGDKAKKRIDICTNSKKSIVEYDVSFLIKGLNKCISMSFCYKEFFVAP